MKRFQLGLPSYSEYKATWQNMINRHEDISYFLLNSNFYIQPLFTFHRWFHSKETFQYTCYPKQLFKNENIPNASHNKEWLFPITIHQIFSLMHDWSKHVTGPNISQPKLGNVPEYSQSFKTVCTAKKIWRIINAIASIWDENMVGYLSLDIICSSKLSFPRDSRKTVRFSELIMYVDTCKMDAIVYI